MADPILLFDGDVLIPKPKPPVPARVPVVAPPGQKPQAPLVSTIDASPALTGGDTTPRPTPPRATNPTPTAATGARSPTGQDLSTPGGTTAQGWWFAPASTTPARPLILRPGGVQPDPAGTVPAPPAVAPIAAGVPVGPVPPPTAVAPIGGVPPQPTGRRPLSLPPVDLPEFLFSRESDQEFPVGTAIVAALPDEKQLEDAEAAAAMQGLEDPGATGAPTGRALWGTTFSDGGLTVVDYGGTAPVRSSPMPPKLATQAGVNSWYAEHLQDALVSEMQGLHPKELEWREYLSQERGNIPVDDSVDVENEVEVDPNEYARWVGWVMAQREVGGRLPSDDYYTYQYQKLLSDRASFWAERYRAGGQLPPDMPPYNEAVLNQLDGGLGKAQSWRDGDRSREFTSDHPIDPWWVAETTAQSPDALLDLLGGAAKNVGELSDGILHAPTSVREAIEGLIDAEIATMPPYEQGREIERAREDFRKALSDEMPNAETFGGLYPFIKQYNILEGMVLNGRSPEDIRAAMSDGSVINGPSALTRIGEWAKAIEMVDQTPGYEAARGVLEGVFASAIPALMLASPLTAPFAPSVAALLNTSRGLDQLQRDYDRPLTSDEKLEYAAAMAPKEYLLNWLPFDKIFRYAFGKAGSVAPNAIRPVVPRRLVDAAATVTKQSLLQMGDNEIARNVTGSDPTRGLMDGVGARAGVSLVSDQLLANVNRVIRAGVGGGARAAVKAGTPDGFERADWALLASGGSLTLPGDILEWTPADGEPVVVQLADTEPGWVDGVFMVPISVGSAVRYIPWNEVLPLPPAGVPSGVEPLDWIDSPDSFDLLLPGHQVSWTPAGGQPRPATIADGQTGRTADGDFIVPIIAGTDIFYVPRSELEKIQE